MIMRINLWLCGCPSGHCLAEVYVDSATQGGLWASWGWSAFCLRPMQSWHPYFVRSDWYRNKTTQDYTAIQVRSEICVSFLQVITSVGAKCLGFTDFLNRRMRLKRTRSNLGLKYIFSCKAFFHLADVIPNKQWQLMGLSIVNHKCWYRSSLPRVWSL